jgi:hypothetical protein
MNLAAGLAVHFPDRLFVIRLLIAPTNKAGNKIYSSLTIFTQQQFGLM